MSSSSRAQPGVATELGYDRVGVPGPDGGLTYLTKVQFERLPLLERVQHLAKGHLRFYRRDLEVPAGDALKGL